MNQSLKKRNLTNCQQTTGKYTLQNEKVAQEKGHRKQKIQHKKGKKFPE